MPVERQSTENDQNSLLRLQHIVRAAGLYTYLEVGSHVGGSLFPHLTDALCVKAVSIDPRPPRQYDERGRYFDYKENTTERMLATLAAAGVSPAQIAKLETHDSDTAGFVRERLGAALAFIDGEHTNRAVFQDFLNVRPHLGSEAICAFHDSNLVFDAITNIEAMLRYERSPFTSYFLPDAVYALAFGEMMDPAERALRAVALDPERFLSAARDGLYREIIANNARLARDP